MKRRLISVRRSAMLLALMGFNSMASTDKPTSYTLKWSEVEGASHYLLEEKQSDGSWKPVAETHTDALLQKITKQTHGTYTYRVSGCITDSSQNVHCGEEVAEYSKSLAVNTKSIGVADVTFEFAATNDDKSLDLPGKYKGEITAVTPGEFRVDEAGNATYQIPLDLPTGAGGMKPQVSLAYSSGNTQPSVAGIGWSLSGISAISRCDKSHYYDNLGEMYVQGVQFDLNDAFCVDGQRLIQITDDGNEQLDVNYDAVYRTENDSFTEYFRVTASGDVTGFVAKTKSGETHFYGNLNTTSNTAAANSVQAINSAKTGNVAINNTWARSSIVDLFGNTIKYDYTSGEEDVSIDQQMLMSSVIYGDIKLTLNYEKSGSKYGFRHGNPFQITQRLQSVSIAVGDKSYKQYSLQYQPYSAQPKLELVTLCQGEFMVSYGCAKPVRFAWHPEASLVDVENPIELEIGDSQKTKHSLTADVNGDGAADIIKYVGEGSWHVNYGLDGRADAFFIPDSQFDSSSDARQAGLTRVADLNGDGRADLLIRAKGKDNIYKWHLVTHAGFQDYDDTCNSNLSNNIIGICWGKQSTGEFKTKVLLEGNDISNIEFADIDGDGLKDVTYLTDSTYVHARKTRVSDTGDVTLQPEQQLLFVDDIDSDLLTRDLGTGQEELLFITSFKWLEVNGDGLSDLAVSLEVYGKTCEEDQGGNVRCQEGGDGYELHTLLNQVGQFPEHELQVSKMNHPDSLKVADLNGDGLTDVIYKAGQRWKYIASNGVGFEPAVEFRALNGLHERDIMVFDYDSDLKQEILTYSKERKEWNAYVFASSSNQLIGGYTAVKIERRESDTERDSLLFGDYDADGLVDWIRVRRTLEDATAEIFTRAQTNKKFNSIYRFTDGMGNATEVTYKPLKDDTVYEGVLQSRFPIITVTNPVYVVAEASSPDGIGGTAKVQYKYANMAFHGQGRGALGFGMLTTTDSRDPNYDIVTTTHYYQGLDDNETVRSSLPSPHLIGLPRLTTRKLVKKSDDSEIVLSESKNTYQQITTRSGIDANVRRSPYYTYVSNSTETANFLNSSSTAGTYVNGGLKSTTTTTQSYDQDGNLTVSQVTVADAAGKAYSTKTVNEYTATASQCDAVPVPDGSEQYSGDYGRYGRLTCATVTKASPDSAETRQSAFAYDDKGMLKVEVANAHHDDLQVATTYGYDKWGNTTSTSIAGKQLVKGTSYSDLPVYSSAVTRTSTVTYDAKGRFIEQSANEGGHLTCFDYDPVSGLLQSETTHVNSCGEAGGLTTSYRYNALGQPTGEESPTGIVTTITRSLEQQGFKEVSNRTGGQPKITYYDAMGRPTKVITHGFDATTTSVVLKEYDAFGRTYQQSVPLLGDLQGNYSSPTVGELTETRYDILGRVVYSAAPTFNGKRQTVSTSYSDFTISELHSSSAGTVTKESVFNVEGRLVSVSDNVNEELGAEKSSISYQYNVNGQLKSTTDSSGNVVTIAHDVLGNKVGMQDPDKGTWQYRYNAFGELKWQKNANGAVTWFDYDAMGRTILRVDDAQSAMHAQVRCFYYDTLGAGTLEREKVVSGHSCSVDANLEFEKSYKYDKYYRLEELTTSIYSSEDESYQVTQRSHYDKLGRIYLSEMSDTFAVGYRFNERGFKYQEVALRYNPSTQKVEETTLKTISEVNHRNQATEESYSGQKLTYGYDGATGLSTGLTATNIQTQTGTNSFSAVYDYNGGGQLKTRTFTGLYSKTRTESFTYDGLNRLSTATNQFGSIKQTLHYCYDALGNMLKKGATTNCQAGDNRFMYGNSQRSTANAGPHALRYDNKTGKTYHYDNNGNMTSDGSRTLHYSGFDKVTQIHKANELRVQFSYGAGLSRYYRKDTYLNGEDEAKGQLNKETFYLGNFERIVTDSGDITHQYTVGNMQITENKQSGEATHRLMVRDYLGSVLAVSEINANNTAGKLVQTFRYDPFGQQFAMNEGTGSVFHGYMRYGFTGHEMLNELNIIHMNGRIYDPTLGRFLQADPHIQAPENSQSYNRYSYVLNNPLSYTDPSGYFFNKIFKGLNELFGDFAPFVGIALMFVPGMQAWAMQSIWNSALIGFVSGGIATGSLKGL
ncbi:hypothetical protein AC626_06480 [Pseudoalteromonas rubra]|uniref:Insecticide toxin TcdB middle/N-terminal domain-containing protein n=1 Tax=Pseudoalteromonas rubra TaxID=43658 RepID=A0A0L0EUQ8_9GAMM|nr:hypothetical protein AC626_06480 [Pseudoalteromonas rubra]